MVDPKNVLEAISPMLDSSGGIRELSHVPRIVGFMRDNATKLASRCVYLMIIYATKNKDILKKLISTDGWSILGSWLEESISDDNLALMTEILNVFSILPVDVEVLRKSSSTPKTIAKLAKMTEKRYNSVAELSRTIVRSWKNLVRSATEKKTGGGEGADNRLTSTSSVVAKMDEDSSSADVIDDMQDAVDTISKPIIPPSITQPSSQKPKISTVKTHPIKFRQTGLEAPSAAAAKRTNAQEDGSTQKRAKLSGSNVFDVINSSISAPMPPAAKKPVPPPPKVVEYRESSGFMDALSGPARPLPPPATVVISTAQAAQSAAAASNSATSPTASAPGLIRRKKRIVPSNLPITESTNATATRTVSPIGTEQQVMAEPSPTSASPPSSAGPSKNGKKRVWWPDDASLRQVRFFEVDHEPLSRQHGDDMKKAEMQLDRSALLKAKQVGEQMMMAEQEEAASETAASSASLRSSSGFSPGSSSPGAPVWKRLIQIDVPENIADFQSNLGRDSTEKGTQTNHQLRVLEVVYFIKRDIPESPAEPNASDMFVETASVTKAIPLDVVPEAVPVVEVPPPVVVSAPLPLAPPVVTLPGPLSSVLAAISGQTTPQQAGSTPPQPMDTTPAVAPVIPPPPPGIPFPMPPIGEGMPPFPPPFDPNLPFPPMPPGPDGAVPFPPFPPPPGMFPFPPGMPFPMPPFPPIGDNGSTVIPPFPGGLPFPPPPVAPAAPVPPPTTIQQPVATSIAVPTSTSPPTIVPVGSSSSAQGLLPTPMDHQAQQSREYHSSNNTNNHHNNFDRRPPVTIRFPAGIPSKVPFGVCRYFYETGSCPRQHYCKFKHIQKPLDNFDKADENHMGGDSPQNVISSSSSTTNNMPGVGSMPKIATAVAAGRR